MRSAIASILALAAVLAALPAQAEEDCRLKRALSLDNIAAPGGSPLAAGAVDGRPIQFAFDTGASFGFMPAAYVEGLKRKSAAMLGVRDLGGKEMGDYVEPGGIELGGARLTGWDFLVSGTNVAGIGANRLSRFDLELDPVERKINLFEHAGCDGRMLPYWQTKGYVVLPFELMRSNIIKLKVRLDDDKLTAMLDTGAEKSILSKRAADDFDLDLDKIATGTVMQGATGGTYRTVSHRFGKLDLGGIAVKNPTLEIAAVPEFDLVIGMDMLASLHLYIAYEQEKIYVTSQADDLAAGRKPAGDRSGADPMATVNANNLLELAASAWRNGDVAKAKADYDQAVDLAPTDAEVLAARARFFADQGDQTRAGVDFDKAIAVAPHDPGTYAARGYWHLGEGALDAALADAEQAIRIAPAAPTGYALRSEIELDRHDYDHALADADAETRFAPAELDGLFQRSAVLLAKGDGPGALGALDQAHKQMPLVAEPLFRRSVVNARLKRYDEALDDIDHAIKIGPKTGELLTQRCWVKAMTGDLRSGQRDCEDALAQSPKFVPALVGRGFIYFKTGKLDAALADDDAALAISPDSPAALYGRGLVRRQRGDASGGEADIAAAVKLQPNVAARFGG